MKFKKGDKVRCVSAGTNGNNITLGKVYEVVACDGALTRVVGDHGLLSAIFSERFELVETPATPPREAVLAEAAKIVNGARRAAYGPPEDNFGRILRFWNAWLENTGRPGNLTLADVPIFMDLMKTARLAESPDHRDSIVDKIGYAACYAEIVLKDAPFPAKAA